MAKESKQTDAVITITPEQQDEHDRRQKIAEKRDKKIKDPNDAAKPAEQPTSEPVSAVDTAAPAATEPEAKKPAAKRRR